MDLGALRTSIEMNLQPFIQAVGQLKTQMASLGNALNNSLGSGAQNNLNGTRNSVNGLASSFKDLDRIVSGIMISQIFYGGVNAIEKGVQNVVAFSNNMEQAGIAMEYFVGNAERAQGFIQNMQDFAADTAFSTEQAMGLSRRLMGALIPPEEVRGVMTILNDANAATGATAQQMDRIVLALTQMKTNGKIAGQELRQLAEAGIPIYQIIREELGLTQQQLSKIGKLGISGDDGVNAVLSGLQKRYKGAADRIADTMGGMWNTIKDDSLFISEKLFEPPMNALRGFLKQWRDGMEVFRNAMNSGGLGGGFEALIPDKKIQETIRRILASFRDLGAAAARLWSALGPGFSMIGSAILSALGQVLPVIANLATWFSKLASAALNAAPWLQYLAAAIIGLIAAQVAAKALMFLWTVTRLGVICSTVAGAVTMLRNAIVGLTMAMVRNPIIAAVMLVVGALVYLISTSKAASQWLDNLMQKIAMLGGMSIDTSTILPKQDLEDANKAAEEFNNQLKDLDKGLKDVGKKLEEDGKKADKAGKKVKDKFVASFDELYQIPDMLDDIGDGLDGVAPENPIKMPELPEIPKTPVIKDPSKVPPADFSDFWKDFKFPPIIENLKNLFNNFQWPQLPSFPISVFDIPINAMLKLLDALKIAVTNFGLNFGNVFAGLPGLLSPFSTALSGLNNLLNALNLNLGSLGLNLGNIKLGLDGITNSLAPFVTALGQGAAWAGSLAVSIAGIGTALGNLGPLMDTFTKNVGAQFNQLWVDVIQSVTEWTKGVTDRIGDMSARGTQIIVDFVGQVGMSFAQLWVDIIQDVTAWAKGFLDKIGSTTLGAGTIIATWTAANPALFTNWRTTVEGIMDGWRKQINTTVTGWATDFTTTLTTWRTNTETSFSTWVTNVVASFTKWKVDTTTLSNLWSAATTLIFGNWKTTNTNVFTNWNTAVQKLFEDWKTATSTTLTNWKTETQKTVWDWANNLGKIFSGGFVASNLLMGEFVTATGATWANFLNDTSGWARDWGMDVGMVFATVANSASKAFNVLGNNGWDAFSGFLGGTADKITDWARGFVSTIAEAVKAAWGWLKNLAETMGETLGGFKGTIDEKVKGAAVNMGAWYDRNKSWAVPTAITVAAVGGAIALAPFTGGWSLAALALEKGGVVDQEQFIKVGEKNRREAVIPMENPDFMRPFSSAVARDLAGMMQQPEEEVTYSRSDAGDTRPIVYVQYLIGDDRGWKELERKLQIVRIQEDERRGRVT